MEQRSELISVSLYTNLLSLCISESIVENVLMFYVLRIKDQKRCGCYNYFNEEKFDMVSELKEATFFKEQNADSVLSTLRNDVHIPFEKVSVTKQMMEVVMSDFKTQKDNFTWEQIGN